MRLKKNIFLNFSSIPCLAKKARDNSNSHFNKELNKLIKLSAAKGFIGVEFPYFRFLNNSKSVENLKIFLKKNNQKYIIDCEKKISKKEVIKLISVSKKLNLKFIRVKCSNILSCERKNYKNKWSDKIKSIIEKINQMKPILKKNHIKLAIENHQDLDSNDILKIIKYVGKSYVGVNFDVGNAFATCELPLEFFKKVKKYIINIHLKDYIILPTKNGYALYKCPIMDGDSQVSKILQLIKLNRIKCPISLEMGAKTQREIKINSKFFFKSFVKEKKKKLKNSETIVKLANKNMHKINEIKKLISLNEINMLNKSIKNLN